MNLSTAFGLSQNALDLPTGLMCLLMAVALSTLHVLSGKDHGRWLTLPLYVRLGFIISAVGMVYRGVELLNLSPGAQVSDLGHIDPVGFVLTCSMTFTFVSLVVYAIRNSYSRRVRTGVEHIKTLARSGPKGEAMATLALRGVKVVGPMEGMPPEP